MDTNVGGSRELELEERPKLLEGTTTRVRTGCGNLYVTIGFNGGRPVEIFATLGKAGGCANCQNEALARSISLGLKYGIPVDKYVQELVGIQCPNPALSQEDGDILSCPDGLARVLRGYAANGNKEV